MRACPARPGLVAVLLCAVALTGCSSLELDENAPADFDLTGHWRATDDSVSSRGDGYRSGFMNQDYPLLFAREMRIEQDARSMGIEYAAGRYRDVSWGKRERGIWDVHAGWMEGELRIYSKAHDTSAVEIWQLSEDGQNLIVDVAVEAGGRMQFHRTFVKSTGL